ncbi:carboxypeptidase-like regulatory domain-containing protein [Flagellimonas sp. HMM57]|uniref:carboxypeptidase-like regulatory domain-containing protein n=1 Tax=unclassified Flagellimonas TaxID=2644544 RepID=UPI0013D1B39C|nr:MULTISPECIES: carboxypeptidase-like regulatory domain-containing protein [unclassified Flagellimonas]UII76710.1 carboxypeptidase-like regulatory domain-containing protein [Flagellimonas sp. HMM57]
MRSRLFFLLLVATIFSTNAQQTSVKQLKGKVFSKGKDVVGVVVQNITTKNAVITDMDGNFSIAVQRNDTLVFSAVQFRRKVLPVTEDILNTNFVTVPLEEFVNELKEVVVRPFDLSGDLGKDIGGLQLEKDVSAEALGLPNAHSKIPTQSERKLQQATFGKFNVAMILSPPLDPIINAITGRTKMLKNRVKVDETYARTQRVQDFYIDSLFISTLKIPAGRIDDFMYFCEVDDEFQKAVDSKDRLRILDYLVLKSRAYRENNDLD